MRSYQHRYHAGNFADIHKQLVLIAVLEALQKKETPFCVVDAFAGEGVYDLNSKEASKNKEYLTGLEFFKTMPQDCHLLQELSKIISAYQQYDSKRNIYPGSSAIISEYLRRQDRGIFIEAHPQAYPELKKNFRDNKNIKVSDQDTFDILNGLVPFNEKRGMIFLDPSYEVKSEYKDIGILVQQLYKKFSNGIYVIWYPLLVGKHYHVDLCNKLFDIEIDREKIWQHEWLHLKDTCESGMYGSGIIVINIPWKVDEMIEEIFRSN